MNPSKYRSKSSDTGKNHYGKSKIHSKSTVREVVKVVASDVKKVLQSQTTSNK